jgi:beta-lactamase superfamily II metal-dependent hydrolase
MASKMTATTKKQASSKKNASSKDASKNKNTIPAGASAGQVRIRMYNVGFGDAFLVLLPGGERQHRILFDCGSVQAAPGQAMSTIVDRIVRDVTDEDGVPRIDVVVGTHRHKDHVSGFGQAAWDKVEVKEVWMPWTEHPTDGEARRIRDIQSRLAFELNAALTMRAAAPNAAEQKDLNRSQDVVANALMLSNDKAMKTLHSGFKGNPARRFLPTQSKDKSAKPEEHRTLETAVLPGIKVHVLGPSRKPEVIRDMDPPKGESFLRMRGAVDTQTALPPPPFPAEFRQDAYSGAGSLPPEDLAEIQRAGSLSDLAVAVALDKAVNGTSLMLMLEVSGTFLLFPGDAQWGTWKAAMEDPEWKDMLGRVAFYKIGHHGSHNATPKDFVDQVIPQGICAMASTLTRPVWPDIPRLPLLNQLAAKKAKIARSDQPTFDGEVFRDDQGVIEARIPL